MNARALMILVPFAGLLFILPFPGTVALRLLCLAAAFGIALFSWRRLDPPSIPAKPALFAWAALALASLLYAVDSAYSLGEVKNEVGYAMMAFIAFFALTRTVGQLRVWGWVVLASATLISIWAALAYFRAGVWDDDGGHGGVGTFASLVVAALPMLIMAHGKPSGGARRALLVLAALSMVIAAVLCQQRALWVAVGLQLVVMVCLLRRTGFLKVGQGPLLAIIAGSVALAGGALLAAHGQRLEKSGMSEVQSFGGDVRLDHWRRVFAKIQEHPLAGAGFGRESMKKAYPDLMPTPVYPLWHPHNVFLTYGIAMGWPGMLALLAVFLSLLHVYWKHLGASGADRKIAAIAGIVLVLGVVTRNLTNDFFVRDGALMFWALNGALLGYLGRSASAEGSAA